MSVFSGACPLAPRWAKQINGFIVTRLLFSFGFPLNRFMFKPGDSAIYLQNCQNFARLLFTNRVPWGIRSGAKVYLESGHQTILSALGHKFIDVFSNIIYRRIDALVYIDTGHADLPALDLHPNLKDKRGEMIKRKSR
jgi:hypothetical protein